MNYYARAIAIVTDPKTDFRALLIEIAKRHPKAVCEVTMTLEGWEKECLPLIYDEKKIGAIKVCRALTGMPLKDAKDAVEALMNRLGRGSSDRET